LRKNFSTSNWLPIMVTGSGQPGTGCDAEQYFRIFNPERQQQRFDPQKEYIKKWVPEYGTKKYTTPVIDHKFARERALNAYKAAVKQI